MSINLVITIHNAAWFRSIIKVEMSIICNLGVVSERGLTLSNKQEVNADSNNR